jgi:hypothetical protein
MLLIVMDPVGWTDNEFKVIDDDSDSDSDTDSDTESEENNQGTKGYSTQKYKKILDEVELLPE